MGEFCQEQSSFLYYLDFDKNGDVGDSEDNHGKEESEREEGALDGVPVFVREDGA